MHVVGQLESFIKRPQMHLDVQYQREFRVEKVNHAFLCIVCRIRERYALVAIALDFYE